MDIKNLEIFVMVAELKNFTEAAKNSVTLSQLAYHCPNLYLNLHQ